MQRLVKTWLVLAMALGTVTVAAGWHVESGQQQAVMIELFTSEGCNSCPPAEEFLNRFTDNPRLWRSFIPLAFHVDYWDYLGWKDRFALPENASRQRRYARLGHVRGVYTPGFVVNGRGWRPGWFGSEPAGGVGDAGVLAVSLVGNRLTARYEGESGARPLELHVAVLGMGLVTEIEAGENAGRQSLHEFVVLEHKPIAGSGPEWSAVLPDMPFKRASRHALVAWVSRPNDPAPLQAVGGYLPDSQSGN